MNIRLFSAVLTLCLLFALLFTACSQNGADIGTDTGISTESYADTAIDTAPQKETKPPETIPPETEPNGNVREPVENEKALSFIEFQYAKAIDAINMAKNGSLEADISNEMLSSDGSVYFPVIDTIERPELDGASIVDFEDLAKYVRNIFSAEIADVLISLASTQYTEIDGILCKNAGFIDTIPETDSGREENRTVDTTEFFLSKFTDNLFRYTAKVTYKISGDEENEDKTPESIEHFDFIFENMGTGWRWTAFPDLPQ